MRRHTFPSISMQTAILSATIAISSLWTTTTATGSLITSFRVYGVNSVVIGHDSRVLSLDVGSDTSVTLNGAQGNVAQVVEDTHSGGLIRYQGESGVARNLYAGGEVRIGAGGSFVDGTIDANTIDFTGAGAGVTVGGNVVYATSFTQQSNGIFGGSVSQGVPTPPDLPVFPAATVFGAGGPDIHDPIAALPPDTYGIVESSLASRPLLFSSGDYYMDSLAMSGGAQMTLDVTNGPIRFFITGDATLGSNKEVTVVGGDDSDVWVEVHGDWTHGGGGVWHGNIFAPTGRIHIGSGGSPFTYNGYMWAEDVDIEHSVTVDGSLPEPSTLFLALLGLASLRVLARRGR